MGAIRAAVACLALAACVEASPEGADRSAQADACDAAVAGHVGLLVEGVATDWRETRADGITVFEARDGDRLHLCAVDAAGRVLRLEHPRE